MVVCCVAKKQALHTIAFLQGTHFYSRDIPARFSLSLTTVLSVIYVIYKPWLRGVLYLYTPRLRSQRKFTVDKRRGEAEAFINSKLLITEEEGCI